MVVLPLRPAGAPPRKRYDLGRLPWYGFGTTSGVGLRGPLRGWKDAVLDLSRTGPTMKRTVVLATFFHPFRESINGEPFFGHVSLHLHQLLWLEASARADPAVDDHYELVVESFEQSGSREEVVRHIWNLAPAVVALSCNLLNAEATLDFCRRGELCGQLVL